MFGSSKSFSVSSLSPCSSMASQNSCRCGGANLIAVSNNFSCLKWIIALIWQLQDDTSGAEPRWTSATFWDYAGWHNNRRQGYHCNLFGFAIMAAWQYYRGPQRLSVFWAFVLSVAILSSHSSQERGAVWPWNIKALDSVAIKFQGWNSWLNC